jgi:hypothetical protein
MFQVHNIISRSRSPLLPARNGKIVATLSPELLESFASSNTKFANRYNVSVAQLQTVEVRRQETHFGPGLKDEAAVALVAFGQELAVL